MAPQRLYYRYRKGSDPGSLDLPQLQRLVRGVYVELLGEGWFEEAFGNDCVDDPVDVGAHILEELGWPAWPLAQAISSSSEEELFTILEFLHDSVAEPLERNWHDWNKCGWHVTASDAETGRAAYRERVNGLLSRYESSYVLRENGEIWEVAPSGLDSLEPMTTEDETFDARVRSAQATFRRYGATDDDKRHAIHDLADVLEHLRVTVGTGLPNRDEARLFEIANQYAIRHYNPDQKTEYDSAIWLNWMYYAFLNAIAVASELISRDTIDRTNSRESR